MKNSFLRVLIRHKSLLALSLGVFLVVGACCVDWLPARPGGGHSFSGGSRSSGSHGGGSGGGGGGGMALFYLLQLLFRYPLVGLIVIGLIILFLVMAAKQKAAGGGWTTAAIPDGASVPPVQVDLPRSTVEKIRAFDPAFSLVNFEDFLYGLYAEYHRARGQHKTTTLSGYFAPSILSAPVSADLIGVENVVVGAMNYVSAAGIEDPSSPNVVIRVRFESNFTEAYRDGRRQGFYIMDYWTLVRSRGAVSRPPDKTRSLGCPGCGAPVDAVASGTCTFCKRQVNTGAFDWVVQSIMLHSKEYRAPNLAVYAPERGTALPTWRAPDLETRFAELTAKDPTFALEAFNQRVGMIFTQFQKSWSARDLSGMRPFLSDCLFQVQLYWIEAYRSQGLRNVTENARITASELVNISSDNWFDTITVRLFATGLDYTLSEAGQLVAGSKSRERAYSEYWTLVRGVGRTGKARADLACPRCGAPLAINMAGVCEYCTAKVTSGEYDWVLSRIEQDEVYRG